ncbi:MAG TPA: type II toxin-antitoxin system death-on-curing family toxin [Candidatus Limnocylindria bacterium]|nr:type II toxin-antitoxin system death-on-curing family toxin [Candidatus Limnocylindria bacterium]
MVYVSHDEALELHAEIKGLSVAGARAELRDPGALASALERPRNAALYRGADLVEQAAALLVGVAESQAFVDGSERIALVVALTFLGANGVVLEMSDDEKVSLMFEIADGLGADAVSARLRRRVRRS